jgi:uridine phosphorylase
MNQDERQYHVDLKPGDVGRYVILPGDPDRVPFIASFLDDAEKVAQKREYVTYTGTYKGIRVSVTSTGIGGPSAAIAMEELRQVGADTFIRLGTSGSLQDHVHIGDLVIEQAVVRDEGTSHQYIPAEFPAVATFEVTSALVEAAKATDNTVHVGIAHCKDAFYAEEEGGLPLEDHWKKKWLAWRRGGTLATEMEGATLFVVGAIRGLRTGGILTVVGETRDGEVTLKKVPVDASIRITLDAIHRLETAEQG